MKKQTRSRISIAALVAAIALCTLAAACTNQSAPAGNDAAPSNASGPASGTAPATNAPAPVTTPGAAPGTQAPPGMPDTLEGRVVGLLCYKENPKAAPDAAVQCAKQKMQEGGALGVLASDGTIYINDKDVRTNNVQLQYFIGEEVTVQGQMIGDAPDVSWPGTQVKKFDMRIVRRKGPAPAGAEKGMSTEGAKVGPKKPGA